MSSVYHWPSCSNNSCLSQLFLVPGLQIPSFQSSRNVTMPKLVIIAQYH